MAFIASTAANGARSLLNANVGLGVSKIDDSMLLVSQSQVIKSGAELPISEVLQSSTDVGTDIFYYGAGEQRRKARPHTLLIFLDKLAIALEDDDVILDYIPLHEIENVQNGHQDIQSLFDEIDADGNGCLSLQELNMSLSRFGISARKIAAFYEVCAILLYLKTTDDSFHQEADLNKDGEDV
eukprot:760422-Hanusia_phi.AAC.1